ncbi:ATP synthase subunit I [Halioxenophilus sp. WMMB6]|uniref:ATP synthase subunit I n=1 Tax=Halioxenophilus sp. WMMB6 TaxID=3073815 RepID=UPI00295E24A8|nr:ATP synthase subunit I [Halioxenophilus sp. WMMB6]
MGSIRKPPVFKVFLIQLLILLPIALIGWLYSATVSYSLLLGGLIQVIPSAYFAFYAFRIIGSAQAGSALQQIYRGEIGKFTLTLLGFALVFVFVKPLHSAALFSAFGLMTLVQWVVNAKVIQ